MTVGGRAWSRPEVTRVNRVFFLLLFVNHSVTVIAEPTSASARMNFTNVGSLSFRGDIHLFLFCPEFINSSV